ncbi:MAG: tyrosine--tRNA ligase [Candidatus Magasanikbacteria bacterium]|nr:tyrosine--tRNA ligase [Candidatus Magasanikbacteria bacterium]
MPVSTDASKINELLTRGVEQIYPTLEYLRERLNSSKSLSLYVGYDPTGPSLHIGHGITLLKLRQFQDLGHKVIMLIGDFTAMIGDPTDKSATRSQLIREQVIENCKEYQRQASAILNFAGDNPAELRYNSEWLAKMNFADVLELASHFTVPRLLERDMFQERIKQGKTIHLHEFLYPIMQGYDSVAMNVDGEAGGNDQTFNMLAGRTLMKELKNKEKFVLSTKLLADNSGKKMGKSEGNMISLDDTAENMFGKVMSWSDEMIASGFELCTRVPMDKVEEIRAELLTDINPRDLKLRLAEEVTKTFLGEEAAQKGLSHFASVIQGAGKPEDMAELKPSSYDILSVLVEAGFAKSNGEARRSIDGRGVKVNEEAVKSYDYKVNPGDVVQKGKRFFLRVL